MTDHPKRESFTKKELLTQWLVQEGRCYCGCNTKLEPGNYIEEHDPPLRLRGPKQSGKPDYLLYRPCAKTKTNGTEGTTYNSDRNKIARQKHREKPKEKKPSTMKSRGFQGHRNFKGELILKDKAEGREE